MLKLFQLQLTGVYLVEQGCLWPMGLIEVNCMALEFCVCVVCPIGTGLFSTFMIWGSWGVLLETPAFSSCWILFNLWLAVLALWTADQMTSSSCFWRYNFFSPASAMDFSRYIAWCFRWAASFSTAAQWSAVDPIFCQTWSVLPESDLTKWQMRADQYCFAWQLCSCHLF